MEDVLIALLAALIGFIAGVVINVLADYLPTTFQIQAPTYPDGTPRTPLAWSGTLAFLTGQRQSAEGAQLSWRHPVVEVGMALGFAFIALNWAGNDRIPIWFIYLFVLVLVAVIDIEHRIIVTPVILVACVLAIIIAVVFPEADRTATDYLIGGGAGLGLFLVMYWGGGVFSSVMASARGETLDEVAFGFGDVYLATLCGLMIGWQAFIFAMLITVFLGAAGAILYLVVQSLRGGYSAFTPLPYGPYIIIGTVILMLWREEIGVFLRGE